jgi:transcription elongation factor Elf1
MSATTQQQTAPKADTRRGFPVPCPLCGQTGNVVLDVENVDGETAFNCGDCGDDFGRQDVERFIERWSACLKWLDAAPTYAAE